MLRLISERTNGHWEIQEYEDLVSALEAISAYRDSRDIDEWEYRTFGLLLTDSSWGDWRLVQKFDKNEEGAKKK